MRDLLVVPARFGSRRLPGKPLLAIAGRTLLERVVQIAGRAAALMTSPDISSGSGRACATAILRDPAPAIVVNLQGDAPFIPAEMVAELLLAARRGTAACFTPIVRLDWPALDSMRAHKTRSPFSGTTCARMDDGRALWFSKAVIPAIRDEAALRAAGPWSPVYRHLGLYAYRLTALKQFEATPATPYERLEGLEQLRFLEMGLTIQTVEVAPPAHAMSGIDTAEDVALAEELIGRLGDPHAL